MNNIQEISKKYRIHIHETGPNAKSTLCSLFNYMQDIASDHAELLNIGRETLMKSNDFWVLSRMYALFYDLPKWQDVIEITTRPSGINRLFMMRDYNLHYSDGRPIADVTSSWLILNKTTKRVQRPDRLFDYEAMSFPPSQIAAHNADKLELPAGNYVEHIPFTVKISDLDINRHTNNVNYIKWVIDSYDLDLILKNNPKSLEINYLGEAMLDNTICVKTLEQDNRTFYHSVFRRDDEKELCRVKIEWQ